MLRFLDDWKFRQTWLVVVGGWRWLVSTVQLWNICKTEGWFHHQSDSSHIGNWKTGPFFWTNLFAQELSSRKVLQRKNLLKAFFEEDQFYWAKSWPLMVLGDNVLPNKCVIDLYDETICSHKQAGIQFSCVEVYIDGKKHIFRIQPSARWTDL